MSKPFGSKSQIKVANRFSLTKNKTDKKTNPLPGTFINYPVEKLKPNPNQPRQFFDEDKLNKLALSIKEKGILQSLLIYWDEEKNQAYLIAGERRLRASKIAGIKTVPCLWSNGDSAEIALIENTQRENLNPIEEAIAYQELQKKHGYTHDEIAVIAGKKRTTITETLSINKLPENIKNECLRADISKKRLILLVREKTEDDMNKKFEKMLNPELPLKKIKQNPVEKINLQAQKIIKMINKIDFEECKDIIDTESIIFNQTPGHIRYELLNLKNKLTEMIALKNNINECFGEIVDNNELQTTQTDRQKVMNSGFKVFRKNESDKKINILNINSAWELYGKYPTKKAMNEAMKELLTNKKNING